MSEQYINANGLRLAYDEFGKPDDHALVLIMGLGTQMVAWPQDLCEDLAGRGFRVIRFDNRDVGLSEKIEHGGTPNLVKLMLLSGLRLPFRVPYTLHDMAKDVVGLLDALDIHQAHVVGASMGGMIAQILAAEAPQRVSTLTSIMSSSGRRGLPGAKSDITRMMIRRPQGSDEEMIMHRVRLFQKIGSQGHLASTVKEIRDKVERSYHRNVYPVGYTRQLAAILHNGSRERLLKSISKPSLVIHGNIDPLVPLECGIDTAKLIPGAKLEVIDNMGHDLPAAILPSLAHSITENAERAG